MIEQELKIVAIDGNSFSGKTTLVEGMRTKYLYGFIPEYDIYAGGGNNFPNFPPENYAEAKKSVDYFLELETRRSGDAVNKALQTNKSLLMDRSFYSCINFQYIVKTTMPEIPNAYLYSLDSFIKFTEEQKIVIPNVLIYIEPENFKVMQKRIGNRGRVSLNFLNEQKTIEVMRTWYEDLIKKCYKDNSSKMMQSLENRLELNLEELNNFLLCANFKLNKSEVISRLSKYNER